MASVEDSTAANSGADHYQEGQILGGKYQLISKAGEGATGAVWIAMNTALQSRVAIKLVHPEMRLPVIVERVMREARAAARLTHSAIVRVFDLGETASGDPYIVMELLEGESLRSMLDRKVRLTPEEALSVLLPLASAMHLAHEQGIIHRDIKPDNIMLARIDGGRIQPKLVDFGIAKLSFGDPGGVTTGALVIGTPGYMSPEQAGGGEAVDHRTDIWSFCALLYEMISGDTPFPSVNTLEALCSVIRDPVPSLLGDRVKDAALWSILDRGLRKDPRERWESMRALGEALTEWLAARGVAEDVSGVPLRALWLGSPPSRALGAAPRPLAGAGRIDSPFRARSEEPVVANSALFAEVSGKPTPKPSRSRYVVMAGMALLAGALVWKVGFSSKAAPAQAANAVETAPPAAMVTATPAPPPPPTAPVAPAPTPEITAPPPAVSVAPSAAPAPPKTVAARWGRLPVRAPATAVTATPIAPAPGAASASDGIKHTWVTPPADAGVAPASPPPAATSGSSPTAPADGN